MNLLRKLLDNLGDMWNKLPKEVPFLTIQKGTGTHSMVTVEEGILYFHSVTFRSEMPQRQSITLKDLTTQELLDTISSMGYVATLTSEAQDAGLDVNKPFILMEVQNVALDATLTAFTSNLWRTMYPLYRILRQANFDTSEALKQLRRDLADGEWLDFWASFFNITREPGEQDGSFIRRFTMWLFNPKTNNIALKELLAYRLQDTDFDVRDKDTPLQFEVYLGTKYLDQNANDALIKILQETKGAGIQYFLNYFAPTYSEDYRMYAADANGVPFENLDTILNQLQKTLAETFPAPSEANTDNDLKVSLAEQFPATSEVSAPTIQKSMAESAFTKPVEAMTRALQSIMSETVPTPSEALSTTLQVPYTEDAYVLPNGNTDTCFELMGSELNNPTEGVDELFDSTIAQDVAVATLTVNGTEVKKVFI